MAKNYGSAKIDIIVALDKGIKKELDTLLTKYQKVNSQIVALEKKKEIAQITGSSRVTAAKLANDAKIQVSANKLAVEEIKAASKAEAANKASDKRETANKMSELEKEGRMIEQAVAEDIRRTQKAERAKQRELEKSGKLYEQARAEDKRRSMQAQKALDRERQKWADTSKQVGNYTLAITAAAAAIGGKFLKAAGDQEQALDMVVSKTIDAGDSAEQIQAKYDKLQVKVSEVANKFGLLNSEVALSGQFIAQATGSIEKTTEALEAITRLKLTDPFADIRTVSDFVTDAIDAIGASYEDVNALVDQFAFTASKTNTDLTQLSTAFTRGATAFRAYAKATDSAEERAAELNTVIGRLASNGIKGERSTRALSTSLTRLSGPTGEAAKTLNKLGIELDDGSGNFIGIIEAVGEFEKGLASLAPLQADAALKTIVGAEAISQWRILLNEGSDSLQRFQGEILNSTGFTEKAAGVVRDNLSASFEKLQSSVTNTSASFASMRSGAVKDMVDGLTELIVSLQKFTDEDKETIVQIGITTVKLTALATVFTKIFIPALIAADARAKTFAITSATKLTPSLLGVKDAAMGVGSVLTAGFIGWQIGTFINEVGNLEEKFLDWAESIDIAGVALARMDKQIELRDQLQAVRDMQDAIKEWRDDVTAASGSFRDIDTSTFEVIKSELQSIADIEITQEFNVRNVDEYAKALDQLAEKLEQPALRQAIGSGQERAGARSRRRGTGDAVNKRFETPTSEDSVSGGGDTSGESLEAFASRINKRLEIAKQGKDAELALNNEFIAKLRDEMVGQAELSYSLGESSNLQRLEQIAAFHQAVYDFEESSGNVSKEQLAALHNAKLEAEAVANEERAEILRNGLEAQFESIVKYGELSEEEERAYLARLVELLEQYGLESTDAFKKAKDGQVEIQQEANRKMLEAESDMSSRFNDLMEDTANDFAFALGKMLGDADSFEDSMKGIFKSVATGLASIALGPIGGSFVGGIFSGFGFAGGKGSERVPGFPTGKGSERSGGLIGNMGMQPTSRANTDNRVGTFRDDEMILNTTQQRRVELMSGGDVWARAGVPGMAGGMGANMGTNVQRVSNTSNTNNVSNDNKVVNIYVQSTGNAQNDARMIAAEMNRLADQGEAQTKRLRGK